MEGFDSSVGSLEVALRKTIWPSLVGPALMPVREMVCVPAPGLRTILEIGSRVGGSFTGRTVRRNDLLAAALLLSVTVDVIVADPNLFAAWGMLLGRLPQL